MKLTIRARSLDLTEELRALVARRVRFSLSRLLAADSRVSVALADVNGPRGGCDKRVLVRVAVPGLPDVIIQEDGDDVAVALDRAVDRAARTCARARDRARLATGAARASRFPRPAAR
jgi:ribosome-associated translation inhibitor RaiA